jgi:4-hydroxymandelate synthase
MENPKEMITVSQAPEREAAGRPHVAGEPMITRIDHLELYVTDADEAGPGFARHYGSVARRRQESGTTTWTVESADVRVLFTSSRSPEDPVARFVDRHGDGVAAIALAAPDVRAAFREIVARGGRPLGEPRLQGGRWAASVGGFGDVRHDLVELNPVRGTRGGIPAAPARAGIADIDHLAICVPTGELDALAAYYEGVFGWNCIFTEQIHVGRQVMNSKVVQNHTATVTLTLIEPGPGSGPGQISDFLTSNAGSGVQHIAYRTPDIIDTVGQLRSGGVEFLTTPDAYYADLTERVRPVHHSVADLRQAHVLLDQDHDGQLFQIFTRSTCPRDTLFMELVERCGAKTFGSRNITALYEAVERDKAGSPGHRPSN